MAAHGVLALIHRNRDDHKLDAVPVLLLRRLHAWQQLRANRAPRRPELHDYRFLADPFGQRDRIAIQISRVTAGGVSPTGIPITSCARSSAGVRSSNPT